MGGLRHTSAGWLLLASAGFIVWGSAFAVLYAMQGLGCALGLQRVAMLGSNMLTVTLAAIWLAHLLLAGCLVWLCCTRWRPRLISQDETKPFLTVVTCLSAASGAFATLYVGLPALLLPPCG